MRQIKDGSAPSRAVPRCLRVPLRPVVFLHIQKCAGTSITELVRPYYHPSIITHGDHAGKRPEAFRDIAFVSGHFGFDFASSFMKDRYSFTFLRDPAERIISYYYYCRTSANPFPVNRLARENGFEEFLAKGLEDPMLAERLWNNQTWQLACGYSNLRNLRVSDFEPAALLALAKDHLREFSHVGFAETFEEDRKIVFSGMGLSDQGETRFNRTPDRPRASEVSRKAMTLIGMLTELDRELYDYAWTQRLILKGKDSEERELDSEAFLSGDESRAKIMPV
ncbi:MAG: sulfotransferase family protein [Candidatus Omnitrophica bacterium]|nr:sulfotransferase family protein [Candidatus Omnitrophota bacterium]